MERRPGLSLAVLFPFLFSKDLDLTTGINAFYRTLERNLRARTSRSLAIQTIRNKIPP